MRKHLLMMVAVCLLALPAMASDLAEQLCGDEVFVTMVNETDKVMAHMQTLTKSEREQYMSSEAFACYRETFFAGQRHLDEAYNFFQRADKKEVLKKAIAKLKQKDPRECEIMYGFYLQSCWGYIDPFAQAECFAWAQAWYNWCMGQGPPPDVD